MVEETVDEVNHEPLPSVNSPIQKTMNHLETIVETEKEQDYTSKGVSLNPSPHEAKEPHVPSQGLTVVIEDSEIPAVSEDQPKDHA